MENKGVIGFGKIGKGQVCKIDPVGGVVSAEEIIVELENKIVVGGELLLAEAVEKAKVIGVAGIVCGGINYRDFKNLSKMEEDFPVVIMGGFGKQKMMVEISFRDATIDGQNLKIYDNKT